MTLSELRTVLMDNSRIDEIRREAQKLTEQAYQEAEMTLEKCKRRLGKKNSVVPEKPKTMLTREAFIQREIQRGLNPQQAYAAWLNSNR